MFKYEMHCHTSFVSACASFTAEEIVETYLANGYDGVVITDHFLNGNTTVNSSFPDASFEEKIEAFCKGYEQVRKVAEGKLKVFFGFEYSYWGTDVLVYGFDKERLKKESRIMDMSMREFVDFCNERGYLTVQAHPFREARYIDHIRLFTNCECVETFNACRNEKCNDLARYYCDAYGKIGIGGSDNHHFSQKILSGMEFEKPADSIEDLIALIRSGKGKIIRSQNVLTAENP